jgi:predicted transcriptional regulator
MKDSTVMVRVDSETDEQLIMMAKRMGISKSAVVRIFINDGLSKFDRRYEAFIERLDHVAEIANKTHEIAAAALAAVTLPEGQWRTLKDEPNRQFKSRVSRAVHFGSLIKISHDEGVIPIPPKEPATQVVSQGTVGERELQR